MQNPAIITTLDNGGRTLHITVSPYSRAAVEKIKTLEGRRWNGGARRWEVPVTDELILKMKDLFGRAFSASNDLYLVRLEKALALRNYSRSTIRNYRALAAGYLSFLEGDPEHAHTGSVEDYLIHLKDIKKHKPRSVNLAAAAVKNSFTSMFSSGP